MSLSTYKQSLFTAGLQDALMQIIRRSQLAISAMMATMAVIVSSQRCVAQEESADLLTTSEPLSVVVPFHEAVQSPTQSVDAYLSQPEVSAWWMDQTLEPIRPEASLVPLTLETLLVRAVSNSSQIRVFSELPLIRKTAVTEADAAFDWAAFIDSRWDDTNDPVGSLLTGASRRYKNNQLTASAGARKRTMSGGLLEASQQVGIQDTNSTFFSPDPQGTSRLKLSYTHPILRGNGMLYNVSLSCLALIDTEVAEAEFSRQMQAHLTEVARAYWGLHIARASVVIRKESLARAQEVYQLLKDREGIDAVRPQILRAEAEVAVRESALTRALMTVRTSEARIRSLVNDPQLGTFNTTEFITLDAPTLAETPVDLQYATETALLHRPEVKQSLDQIRAACIRLRMSKTEMLPVLNVVTETYVAGLQDNASVGDAWVDQFSVGGPGYAVGAEFETPLGRRAAKAQRERRILECRQLRNQYETTLNSLKLEVGVAVREVKATFQEIHARQLALEANQTQLTSTMERWKLLPGEDGSGALMMEAMLRDQERLTRAELALLESWISYNMALFNLRKATGELLRTEQVSWTDYRHECGMTERVVHKPDLGTIGGQ